MAACEMNPQGCRRLTVQPPVGQLLLGIPGNLSLLALNIGFIAIYSYIVSKSPTAGTGTIIQPKA